MFMIYSTEERQLVEVSVTFVGCIVIVVCVVPELLEFCLNEGFADRNLIAKWKKVIT